VRFGTDVALTHYRNPDLVLFLAYGPMTTAYQAMAEQVVASLKAAGVKVKSPIVVRIVSRKGLLFAAPKELQQRYGASYATEFPYLSQAIFAFQSVGGRDVLLFAVYVQEYDADCPPPNTNRTYISYVDSVRYLESEPRGARTPVYHAVLTGYLKHAASKGFEHAHLWIAPPELGSEYVFHCPPTSSRPPMGADVLQAWYEKMLERARQLGIVAKVDSLQQHVAKLTSVRDFPLFDGDFFPDRLPDVIEKGKQPPPPPPPAAKGKAKAAGGLRKLVRSETLAIADELKNEVSGSDYGFLVATLHAARDPPHVGREKHIGSHELVDDRERFLEMCISRHWQFEELARAHYSTMMLLAVLGGAPEGQ